MIKTDKYNALSPVKKLKLVISGAVHHSEDDEAVLNDLINLGYGHRVPDVVKQMIEKSMSFCAENSLPLDKDLLKAISQVTCKLSTYDIAYIAKNTNNSVGSVSDGYHTFDELYEHRAVLYIALCRMASAWGNVWRSTVHSDGTEWPGWFILGMWMNKGSQITYHLPWHKWNDCDFAETLEKAPEFDGHTSADVLERLSKLYFHKQ